MCDVHLVETRRESLWSDEGITCCYCQYVIEASAVRIEGTLDDGSPGTHVFMYHEDCVWDMEHDLSEENDGCFSYGTPLETTPAPSV